MIDVPGHVAIIMDGNGRWATSRGLPRYMGHRKGMESVERVISLCESSGVKVLSLFAFSTENWKRDSTEVDFLFNAFAGYLDKKKDELVRKGIQLKVSGRRSGLPESLCGKIEAVQQATESCDKFVLNILFNYGGRAELLDAAIALHDDIVSGAVSRDKVTEALFAEYFYSPSIPDVDLLIRTSGELRLSNFMLWRLAYAELYFTSVYWPEFGEKEFIAALNDFEKRRRRFGVES